MVSPEVLRRYPFFAQLDETELRAIATITTEASADAGAAIFEEDRPAEALFLLESGGVDLHHHAGNELTEGEARDFHVGHINPGEVFCISAVLEPFRTTASAVADGPTRFLRIDAAGLRALCEVHPQMSNFLVRRVAAALSRRLRDTRLLLAAAQK